MKKTTFFFVGLQFLLFYSIFLSSCEQKGEGIEEDLYTLNIPVGFPKPNIETDNPLTKSSVVLGKKLFFDPILSRDSSIACVSCHHPSRAFSDTVVLSRGVEGRLGNRNAPTLMNLAYYSVFMRDGGARTLPLQVLIPLTDHAEMDFSAQEAVERLRMDSEYVEMTRKAYGSEINTFTLTRALAAFERTLINGNSAFDQYYFQSQKEAFSAAQIRGWELFRSEKTNCSKCHKGFNFTNNAYENNGLYSEYKDEGRFLITRDSADIAKFKVPTLRNIGLTAPYMHDGSIGTLEEVIGHYESGGKQHIHKNPMLQSFELTEEERNDLKAFLESLTEL
ncbi:MAG: cytochrome-c peroxidase [Chitinophagales bacterium]